MRRLIPSARQHEYCSRPVEGTGRMNILEESRNDRARTEYAGPMFRASDVVVLLDHQAGALKPTFPNKSEAFLRGCRT